MICVAPQVAAKVPAPPTNVTAAKAYAALERNCAGCHQAGRLETKRAGAAIANILDLEAIARDPALVRPGVPDASRLYGVALANVRHHDILNDPALPVPSPTEVQALRDWIADLPPRMLGQCASRSRITPSLIARRLATALSALDATAARDLRFVSLAGLYNDCATAAELDGLRLGVRALLAQAAQGRPAHRGNSDTTSWPAAIDPEQLILPVPLARLGWSAESWDELVAQFPLRAALRLPRVITDAVASPHPVLPADWLAATLLARLAPAMLPAADSVTVWGLPAAEALRHAWQKPVDFNRAAADLWLEPAEFTSRLQRGTFDASLAARQLTSGAVSRRERVVPLLRALTADERLGRTHFKETFGADAPHDIALWTEAPTYRAGDTAVLNVATSRDCHLTLVNIDRSGRAIVLFPNELEPDNLIRAGRVNKVPSFNSPYRFRFKEKGREIAIAICSLNRQSPAGIVHDYDRQRFTTLGDWQLFLREPPDPRAARNDDAATETPRAIVQPRRRGRRGAPARADPPSSAADDHVRSAITIDIQ
jgi:hypothetical protein